MVRGATCGGGFAGYFGDYRTMEADASGLEARRQMYRIFRGPTKLRTGVLTMNARKKRSFPDVHRLLWVREDFRALQGDGASSVPAFLAWKAFLIVTRLETGSTEKEKVCASCRASIEQMGLELDGRINEFAMALSSVNNVTDPVVAEWT